MNSKYKSRVVGVIVCAAFVGFLIWSANGLASSFEVHRPPPIVVGEPSKGRPTTERGVVFCLPLVEERTGTQLIGVAVIDLSQPRAQLSSKGTRTFSPECQLGKETWWSSTSMQNVVVRKRDGSQRLLFGGPIMFERLVFPAEDCAAGVGVAPCDHLYWEVRETDTNADGVIDSDDALALYISSMDASELRRITPEGSTLIAVERDVVAETLTLQVQVDKDRDGAFGPRDPAPLVEYSLRTKTMGAVVSPEVAAAARRMLL